MPSTRQEQREAKRPVTVPFSITMQYAGELAAAESPRSRGEAHYLGGYVRRGLNNPQAVALLAKYGELWAQADAELEFEESIKRLERKRLRKVTVRRTHLKVVA